MTIESSPRFLFLCLLASLLSASHRSAEAFLTSSSFGGRLHRDDGASASAVAAASAAAAGTTILQRRRSSSRSSSSSSTTTSTTTIRSATTATDMEGGVSLAELTALEEDASYLEGAIRDSLDDEWIPQACHAEIGKEVAKIYLSARRERGVDDLNSLLVDWGTGLTGFSGMGDAFVGAWDVANQAADLVLLRLGRERCGCSVDPTTPHFSADAVAAVKPALEKHFTKYQWLRSVLEGDADWDAVSTVAALAMGFRVGPPVEGADVKSSKSESILSGGVKDPVLAEAFGALPPRLDAGAGALLGKLEEALPEEDTEEREALLDMVRTIVGEAATCIAEAEGDREFLARSTVVQWLINVDFLNREDLLEVVEEG